MTTRYLIRPLQHVQSPVSALVFLLHTLTLNLGYPVPALHPLPDLNPDYNAAKYNPDPNHIQYTATGARGDMIFEYIQVGAGLFCQTR